MSSAYADGICELAWHEARVANVAEKQAVGLDACSMQQVEGRKSPCWGYGPSVASAENGAGFSTSTTEVMLVQRSEQM